MNGTCSISSKRDVILPIDELTNHHFSRWAHCTTNQRYFPLKLSQQIPSRAEFTYADPTKCPSGSIVSMGDLQDPTEWRYGPVPYEFWGYSLKFRPEK